MINAQNSKCVSITPPAAIVDNAALTCASVDTLGYDYATILFYLGATDIAMTVLKVRESDDDSTYSDITGTVIGTDTDFVGTTSVLPSATDDNKIVRFDISLVGRKRYLKLSATCGDGAAGTYAAALALLSRPERSPTTESEAGCLWAMRV